MKTDAIEKLLVTCACEVARNRVHYEKTRTPEQAATVNKCGVETQSHAEGVLLIERDT
jgi:hypothetical protein